MVPHQEDGGLTIQDDCECWSQDLGCACIGGRTVLSARRAAPSSESYQKYWKCVPLPCGPGLHRLNIERKRRLRVCIKCLWCWAKAYNQILESLPPYFPLLSPNLTCRLQTEHVMTHYLVSPGDTRRAWTTSDNWIEDEGLEVFSF